MSESGNDKVSLKFPKAAAGTVGDNKNVIDKVYLNDEIFGIDKTNSKYVDPIKYGISNPELLSHEVGHNFGLHHKKGDYSQKGLMSIKSKDIPATTSNNIEVINDNLKSIELKEDEKKP